MAEQTGLGSEPGTTDASGPFSTGFPGLPTGFGSVNEDFERQRLREVALRFAMDMHLRDLNQVWSVAAILIAARTFEEYLLGDSEPPQEGP